MHVWKLICYLIVWFACNGNTDVRTNRTVTLRPQTDFLVIPATILLNTWRFTTDVLKVWQSTRILYFYEVNRNACQFWRVSKGMVDVLFWYTTSVYWLYFERRASQFKNPEVCNFNPSISVDWFYSENQYKAIAYEIVVSCITSQSLR